MDLKHRHVDDKLQETTIGFVVSSNLHCVINQGFETVLLRGFLALTSYADGADSKELKKAETLFKTALLLGASSQER